MRVQQAHSLPNCFPTSFFIASSTGRVVPVLSWLDRAGREFLAIPSDMGKQKKKSPGGERGLPENGAHVLSDAELRE